MEYEDVYSKNKALAGKYSIGKQDDDMVRVRIRSKDANYLQTTASLVKPFRETRVRSFCFIISKREI